MSIKQPTNSSVCTNTVDVIYVGKDSALYIPPVVHIGITPEIKTTGGQLGIYTFKTPYPKAKKCY